MQNIINLSTEAVKIHPRNIEFFDDISGNEYETFRDSIKEEGVLTPLIVANDMTLVSGHQRLKAAQDIGVTQLPVIIREDLTDEDEKLKILLAANFGRHKNDDKKQRRIAAEYDTLRGKKTKGRNKKYSDNRSISKKEIANELGVSESTLYEMLDIERKLTPEIKEILDNGAFTKTTASKILVKLTQEEQQELLAQFGAEISEGATQAQMQEYVNKIRGLEMLLESEKAKPRGDDNKASTEELSKLLTEKQELEARERRSYERCEQLKKEVDKLKKEGKAKEVVEVEVIKEVVPPDYERTKEELKRQKKEVKKLNEELLDTKMELSIKRSVENNVEYDYELFHETCFKASVVLDKYKFRDLEYAEMSQDELMRYMRSMEELQVELTKVNNKIKEFMS